MDNNDSSENNSSTAGLEGSDGIGREDLADVGG